MSQWIQQKCKPCEGGTRPLGKKTIQTHLAQLPGWQKEGQKIVKVFSFKNYYETMAFVNAVAFIAHREDHHPNLEVSYKVCKVSYWTHAVNGLSENDFICAAKIEALTRVAEDIPQIF